MSNDNKREQQFDPTKSPIVPASEETDIGYVPPMEDVAQASEVEEIVHTFAKELTAHEIELLDLAIPYVKGVHDSTADYPTVEDLRRFLHCRTDSAKRILSVIRNSKMVVLASRAFDRHERATAKALVDVAIGDTQFKSNQEYYIRELARLTRLADKRGRDLVAERALRKNLSENHAGYDEFLAHAKDFVQLFGDFQLPTETVTLPQPALVPAVSSDHTEDAVLMLSDTHFGDVIRAEDTSGFPEFDLVIAGNRFGYVVRKAKQVLTLHRSMYPLKKLYVWVGGDIGNGILHDSPNSNALFPPAQVHFSYHMLKFAIEDLLALTEPDPQTGVRVIEEIVLLFTVGNHMRMDILMPHKYQAQRNLDWLIYQFIIERFSSHPRVKIHTEMSPFIFEKIRGHRHLFCHGMQVGFRNSPDAQNKAITSFLALARGLFDSPEWRKKNGLEGETFSRACIGDIHIPITYPRFKSNGSLNGQNELGVNWTLEPIPAGQQIWGVTEDHQETWQYYLECTKIQRAKNDFNNYGVFAAEYAKRIGRC